MSKKKQRSITRIELFGERDKNHPRNETYEGIEHFTGLVQERTSTDKWFIIPFIIPNLVLIALIYPVFLTSDINRLSYPWDFRADVCGKPGTTLEHMKYLYFFDPINVPNIGYCVYECPNQENIETCFYDVDGVTLLNDYCYWTMETFTYERFCIPSQAGAARDSVWNFVLSQSALTKRAAYDIYMSSDIQAICVFIMVLVGLAYIGLLIAPKGQKYAFKFFLIMPILFCGWLAWVIFDDTQNVKIKYFNKEKYFNKVCPSGTDNGCSGFRYILLRAANVVVVVAVLAIYMRLFLQRNRIKNILNYIFTMTRPIRNLPAIFAFAFLHFFFQMIIVGALMTYFVILMASGSVQTEQAPVAFPNSTYRTWATSSYVAPLFPIIIIVGIWWLYIAQLFQRMVISATVSCWFFAREKTILHLPLLQGLRNTLRYHMGSIIKASLMIPFATPINYVMEIIRVKLKKMNRGTKQFKFWMGTCTPPLIFFEHVIKYISEKPLAQISVFGDPYYFNCVRQFYLWYRNDSRIKEIKFMVGHFNNIGKFFIILLCCTVCYFWISFLNTDPAGLYLGVFDFPFTPPFVMFLFGIFVCESTSNTIDLVIDSLFYVFTLDEEMYFGRQRHVELDLLEFMDLYGKEAVRANDLEVRARGGRDGHHEEDINTDQRAMVQLGSEETERKIEVSHNSDEDNSETEGHPKKEEKKAVNIGGGLHFDNLSVDVSQEIPEDSKEDDESDIQTHTKIKEETPLNNNRAFNAIDIDGIHDMTNSGNILDETNKHDDSHDMNKPLIMNRKPMDRAKVGEMLKEKQAIKLAEQSGVFDNMNDPIPKALPLSQDKIKLVNASVDFSDPGGLTIHKDATNMSDINNSAANDINKHLFEGSRRLGIRDVVDSDAEDEEDLEATNKKDIGKNKDNYNF